ncbi:MAG: hypothetical protein COA82_00380 [Alkaliphilus sp.]|nr:DUF881 domain-containing protein [bacterium AH-315-G05]MBN4074615.1 DUF881 domain-containing protein [bacterium AH-315-E09]PHS36468.1 MAG: hypothetical protein COA82_00380 [Alkaliphilus sp.]
MRKTASAFIIIITFVVLGYFITFHFRNISEEYSFVSIRNITELQNEINRKKEEIRSINGIIVKKRDQLKQYEVAIKEEGTIKEVLRSKIEIARIHAGFVDIEGTGVIIVLRDSERDLYKNEDPNNLIVHESDILVLLNELKVAGAEALSVNGQRVLFMTGVKCTGPTITINGFTYGQPFIIKAIGNTTALNAAIMSPNASVVILKEVFGLDIKSRISPRVRIAKFSESTSFKHLTVKEGY